MVLSMLRREYDTVNKKKFVETNIEIIEDNKWFLLFMSWYNNPHKEFPDTQQWNELIEVLQHIDKNILETTI